LRCAIEIRREAHGGAEDLYCGVHTGEFRVGPNSVSEEAVELAAGVCAAARPGELLVSRTVKELAVGSGLRFSHRAVTPGGGTFNGLQLFEVTEESPGDGEPAGDTDGRTTPAALSSRELEVLRLVASGQTNSQIAETLVVSSWTVASHVQHILRKTGCANRTEAVGYAIRNRLV
jgi:DNA-binding NarL/FixJ family response regulator